MENFFLFLLSLLILLNAIMIITNKNPVHSILFLVLVFTLTTGFLLILGVEFIAMLFLVVYVGAITVLFLFVVMMEISEKILGFRNFHLVKKVLPFHQKIFYQKF